MASLPPFLPINLDLMPLRLRHSHPSPPRAFHKLFFLDIETEAMAVDSSLPSPLGPPACESDAKKLQFIEELTRNTDQVQETVLAEILAQNAEAEYLKRYDLAGATDRQMFKSKLPVITYEDLQPEIQRIANGDRSPILSSHPISEFLTRFEITIEIGSSKLSLTMFMRSLSARGLQPGSGSSCRRLEKNWIAGSSCTAF